VDDEPATLERVGSELRLVGYQVRTAPDARAAWEQFATSRPDLVVADVRMPGESGIELLRRIRAISDVPVILLTARADVHAAVDALRAGATDFVRFPEEAGELLRRAQQLTPVSDSFEPADAASALLRGESAPMQALRDRVRALAGLAVPVLVSGEPGSGRMRVARALHALSATRLPLVAVAAPDCAVPAAPCAVALVELEHWRPDAQERWSRALRAEGEPRFERIFTIATPALAAAVERGDVRRELWLRLSRFRVEVPSLRARASEIPRIARTLLGEIAERHGRAAPSLSSGALDSLCRRPWRGNLPELRDVLEHAVAFAKSGRLARDDVDRAFEEVIAAREESLANRRAAKQSADRAQLVRLLGDCRGNVAEVARQLGMTRGAVTYRLRKHGLSR
jgi:two-component system C4-dicarboxylate transport response regulator DctD